MPGAQLPGLLRSGEGVKVSTGARRARFFSLSLLGGVGKSLHSWQLEGGGEGNKTLEMKQESALPMTQRPVRLISKAGWIIWR